MLVVPAFLGLCFIGGVKYDRIRSSMAMCVSWCYIEIIVCCSNDNVTISRSDASPLIDCEMSRYDYVYMVGRWIVSGTVLV